MKTPTSHQKAAEFHFALGHPRRLRIINVLNDTPKGLTFEMLEDETLIFGASLSHHLRFLKDAGIVHRQIRDRFSIYTLDTTYMDRMMTSGVTKPIRKAA